MSEDRETKKKIDESWKEQVEREKGQAEPGAFGENAAASFALLLLGMRMDCLIALGEIENPVDKTKKTDLARAKYVTDMLGIIQDKTKNNLTREEAQLLDSALYELRMRYLAKTKTR